MPAREGNGWALASERGVMSLARVVPFGALEVSGGGGPDALELLVAIDDDASRLYAEHGVSLGLGPGHPFLEAEQVRWERALARGDVRFAEVDGRAVGAMVLGRIDGVPYLDQLSVRMDAMGRGVGSALLDEAKRWAAGPLVLTTYAHLPWNGPFYRRRGFLDVPEASWGPEVRAVIEAQRLALPEPRERIVMRYPGPSSQLSSSSGRGASLRG